MKGQTENMDRPLDGNGERLPDGVTAGETAPLRTADPQPVPGFDATIEMLDSHPGDKEWLRDALQIAWRGGFDAAERRQMRRNDAPKCVSCEGDAASTWCRGCIIEDYQAAQIALRRPEATPHPNIAEILAKTDGMPLVDALSYMATWENERAVAQALRGIRDPNTGALWDTCFRHAFQALFDRRGSGEAQPELHYGCVNCGKPIVSTGLCEPCGIADTTGHYRAIERCVDLVERAAKGWDSLDRTKAETLRRFAQVYLVPEQRRERPLLPLAPNVMDAPGHPRCACGNLSQTESGACLTCATATANAEPAPPVRDLSGVSVDAPPDHPPARWEALSDEERARHLGDVATAREAVATLFMFAVGRTPTVPGVVSAQCVDAQSAIFTALDELTEHIAATVSRRATPNASHEEWCVICKREPHDHTDAEYRACMAACGMYDGGEHPSLEAVAAHRAQLAAFDADAQLLPAEPRPSEAYSPARWRSKAIRAEAALLAAGLDVPGGEPLIGLVASEATPRTSAPERRINPMKDQTENMDRSLDGNGERLPDGVTAGETAPLRTAEVQPCKGCETAGTMADMARNTIANMSDEIGRLRAELRRNELRQNDTQPEPGGLDDPADVLKAIHNLLDANRERAALDVLMRFKRGRPDATSERPPITHVAVRWDGRIWSLPRPFRHHHIIAMISQLTGETSIDCHEPEGQGFLDESGRYLMRKQALVSALLNKQVLNENDIRCGMLFSEDLW